MHLLVNVYDVVDGLSLFFISSVHLFVNFYDVVDGFLLRCRVSGIGSVSLFVSNMLTLHGSELFPVCISFFGVSGE